MYASIPSMECLSGLWGEVVELPVLAILEKVQVVSEEATGDERRWEEIMCGKVVLVFQQVL